MNSYKILKPILFRMDPEAAHLLTLKMLKMGDKLPFLLEKVAGGKKVKDEALSQELLGRRFSNPVGLAAGYDKNAEAIRGLSSLCFGFIEVGTVTPLPQEGNPRPRIFRHPEHESVQNAMGFPNDGMKAVYERVRKVFPADVPVGVNIGKNKATPQEEAIKDYELLLATFRDICDYMVINISSPNTPGLRDLQNERFIREIFNAAKKVTGKPIFLKISPDMEPAAAVQLSTLACEGGAAGIIATNTTTDYSLIPQAEKKGGLSGKVLKEKSRRFFREISRELFGKTILISAGGIDSGEEAYERIKAGASLVQIYSALIYRGPSLPEEINRGLLRLIERDGIKRIGDAVGVEAGQR